MNFKEMNSLLFAEMSEEEIAGCISCSKTKITEYKKNSFVFSEGEIPEKLFLLLSGEVSIVRYTLAGEKVMITTFSNPGDLFGEAFLFLPKKRYEYFAEVKQQASLLEIPKSFFLSRCERSCGYHDKLINNMMLVFAQKTYFLTKKTEVLSANNLRQRIARFFMQRIEHRNYITLTMNREEMAVFLGTTRPSLSRELMKMQEEGMIKVNKNKIEICNLTLMDELI